MNSFLSVNEQKTTHRLNDNILASHSSSDSDRECIGFPEILRLGTETSDCYELLAINNFCVGTVMGGNAQAGILDIFNCSRVILKGGFLRKQRC